MECHRRFSFIYYQSLKALWVSFMHEIRIYWLEWSEAKCWRESNDGLTMSVEASFDLVWKLMPLCFFFFFSRCNNVWCRFPHLEQFDLDLHSLTLCGRRQLKHSFLLVTILYRSLMVISRKIRHRTMLWLAWFPQKQWFKQSVSVWLKDDSSGLAHLGSEMDDFCSMSFDLVCFDDRDRVCIGSAHLLGCDLLDSIWLLPLGLSMDVKVTLGFEFDAADSIKPTSRRFAVWYLTSMEWVCVEMLSMSSTESEIEIMRSVFIMKFFQWSSSDLSLYVINSGLERAFIVIAWSIAWFK